MAKKNNDYWKGRFEQLEDASHKRAETVYASIENSYIQAQKEIERNINNWYVRFANNNQITLGEAKKLLNSNELKELKWDIQEYIKYGHENKLNDVWMKELENASAKYHISRLEALKLQTQQSLEVLFGNQLDEVDNLTKTTYLEGYYHNCYEIQKGFGIGWNIASIDNNKLQKIVSKPWVVDGKNFSERIWGNKTKLINEVHNQLTIMCVQGKSPDDAIKYLSKKFNTSKAQAGNLIMTENAYFTSLASKDCFNELDVEEYENVATLDSHTSAICQDMDGSVFPMKDYQPGVTAPPFHNYCRTVTVPHFADDYGEPGERAVRDEKGNTYYISDKIKYKDWQDQFVVSPDKLKTTIKPVSKPTDVKPDTQEITDKQKEAVEYYVSGDGMYINDILRGRNGLTLEDLTEQDKELMQDLDEALNRTIEPQTLYRNVDASAIFGNISDLDYDNLKSELTYKYFSGQKGQYAESVANKCNNLINKVEGKTFIDKGYVSTTLDEKIANEWQDFTGSEKPIVLKITTDKTVKGLDVSNLTDKLKEVELENPQKEILLARNQTFTINKVYGQNGNIYVDVKVSNKDIPESIEDNILKEKAKNDIIINKNKWTNFKTVDEAKEYVYTNYIDSDIDKLKNVDTLNATFSRLDELQNKYPLNNNIFVRNTSKLKDANATGNFNGIQLNTSVFNKVERKARIGDDWIKHCDDKIEDLKQYLGNPKYKQKPIEKGIRQLENQKKFKCFSVSNSFNDLESLKSTISHEYGHVLADQYFGQINKFRANKDFEYFESNPLYQKCRLVQQTYAKALNDGEIYNISYYASTSEYEFFAECFAKKEMQQELPDYIEDMLERVLSKDGK